MQVANAVEMHETAPTREAALRRAAFAARRLAESRLFQFLALGALIFAGTRSSQEDVIRIEQGDLLAVRAEHAHKLGVPALTPEQQAEVDARLLSDTILVREARRLGLERDDRLVQQRLAQKVLFLAEDLGGASREPSEVDLRAFFDASGGRYVRPERFRFVHVYASSSSAASAAAEAVRRWDEGAHGETEPPPFGEPLPVQRFVDTRAADVATIYGASFVDELRGLPPGSFSRPIRSRLGWHLVKVLDHAAARPATFDEVRRELPLDWLIARREAAVSQYLASAFRRYRVEVAGQRLAALPDIKRTAAHAQDSAED